jgi:sarcosine oxidase gamma subunit
MAGIMSKSTLTLDLEVNRLDELEVWLRDNVGLGGRRYASNEGETTYWLGPDDWLYYLTEEENQGKAKVTFIFRRESDAIMFGLKW